MAADDVERRGRAPRSRRRSNARSTPAPFLRAQSMPTKRKRGRLQSRSPAGRGVVAADADHVDLRGRDPVVARPPTRRPTAWSGSTPRPARRRAAGAPGATRTRARERSLPADVRVPLRLGDGHVLEGRDRHVGGERVAGPDLHDPVERARLPQPPRARPTSSRAASSGDAQAAARPRRRRLCTGAPRAEVGGGEGVEGGRAHERRRLDLDGHGLALRRREPAHDAGRACPTTWRAGSGLRGMRRRCADPRPRPVIAAFRRVRPRPRSRA